MIQAATRRASTSAVKNAQQISDHVTSALPLQEMRNSRGQNYSTTQFYQLRFKPIDRKTPLSDVLTMVEDHLRTGTSRRMGITQVQVNQRSQNSGKYSSVSFVLDGANYDIVVALGGNAGETFEKELLQKMDALLKGRHTEDLSIAIAAFDALERLDAVFALPNISAVAARTGSTKRSGDMSPEDTGAIIADIIVHLRDGGKKYISVKNNNGNTVAQFGISAAFNDDLTVNVQTSEWRNWCAPFDLDPMKVMEGLRAARDGVDLSFDPVELRSGVIPENSQIFTIMRKMWGANYYYLRESRTAPFAKKIDTDYVNNVMLKNLEVTEVRYPASGRKQITVYLRSDHGRFKLEFRNPRGARGGKPNIRPSQIQLIALKSAK